MSRTCLLLRTTLYNYFSINEILDPNSKKKNEAMIIGMGVITLGIFIGAYNTITANFLIQLGQGNMIPAYMVAISSFAILLFTLLRSNGIMFGCRDFELLSALPIKSSEIITSKFGFMYLLNLLLCILFMIPGGIVWAINTELNLIFAILYFLSVLFVPLIPMCISTLAGVCIVVISSRFRNKSIVSVVFSFIVLGFVGYIAMESQLNDGGGNLGVMLVEQLSGIYPISKMFLIQNTLSFIGLALFIILSSTVFCFFVKLIAPRYIEINTLVVASKQRTVGRREAMKPRSKFVALYRKELGRFFGSYMVLLNTGLGVVMLCVFSILLLVMPTEFFGKYAGIPNLIEFIEPYAPFIISAFLTLSSPAASSVSLEGKNVWILQSVPISTRLILNSKIAVTLSLHCVGYFVAVASFALKLSLTWSQSACMLLLPIIYSAFTAVQGIYFNCRFPDFGWDNEMVVVKQSMSVILSNVIGMIAVAIPILIIWFVKTPFLLTLWSTAILLIFLTGFLYQKAMKTKVF